MPKLKDLLLSALFTCIMLFPSVPAAYPTVSLSVRTIKEDGGRVDWSHSGNNLIAFDKLGADGYFDVYVMKPDGSDENCLTDKPGLLPQKHNGQPAWHPSGEYIVFEAEKEFHYGSSNWSVPGSGINCDLWVVTSDGNSFYQLTNLPLLPLRGVLHPHFSHDGSKLFWAERLGPGGMWGVWALKVADFIVDINEVRLENIRTYQPGSQHLWYESHGFSQDDAKVIFSGNLELGQNETGMDIYTLDLSTQELKRLTTTMVDWDEHAHYSPDGKKIVWMSSMGYSFDPDKMEFPLGYWGTPADLKTDYWIMNANGSDKRRLTYFNEPGHPEYIGGQAIASDCSWSPDGNKLVALVLDVQKWNPMIVIIEFNAVGGIWIPVDKLSLLAPYIGLASTIISAIVVTVFFVKLKQKKP